jgi:hypothetical protein
MGSGWMVSTALQRLLLLLLQPLLLLEAALAAPLAVAAAAAAAAPPPQSLLCSRAAAHWQLLQLQGRALCGLLASRGSAAAEAAGPGRRPPALQPLLLQSLTLAQRLCPMEPLQAALAAQRRAACAAAAAGAPWAPLASAATRRRRRRRRSLAGGSRGAAAEGRLSLPLQPLLPSLQRPASPAQSACCRAQQLLYRARASLGCLAWPSWQCTGSAAACAAPVS